MLKYGEYWEKDLYYVTEEQAKKWTVGWREHPVDPSSDPGILYKSIIGISVCEWCGRKEAIK